MARRIILASQSPRRKELLEQVGVVFEVVVADIDETVLQHEAVNDYVLRVATQKAETVAIHHPDALVIAADTTVISPTGEILSKPTDANDAKRMWRLLSGQIHQVKTTVVIAYAGQLLHDTVTTDVHFKEIHQDEMAAYWQTSEPRDKAGAYAIQGRAAAWVKRIEGSYSNVVGLPLYETLQLLQQIKYPSP